VTRSERLCHVSEVPADSVLGIDRGRLRIGLAYVDGKLRAFDTRCPHTGADLSEGILDGDGVDCPHHLWHFELTGGACTMVPGYGIDVFPVRIDDSWVVVELPD